MTAENITEAKTKTDANTRAILIGKINYKLDLNDPAYANDREAARAWLKGMKRQFDNYDIVEDDQKVAACIRNLTGYADNLAEKHGKFDSFEQFEKWFAASMRIPPQPQNITLEMQKTVQTGKFRLYGRKFLELNARNALCQSPVDDSEMRRWFLENMRNMKLKNMLVPQPGSLTDLVVMGEDIILAGHVPDYSEFHGNRSAPTSYRVSKEIPSGPAASKKSFKNARGNNYNRRSYSYREPGKGLTQQQLYRASLEIARDTDHDDDEYANEEGAPLKG